MGNSDRLEIRVASIPANHPYVRHLSAGGTAPGDPGPDTVRRLPDPRPLVDHPLPGQWWPPRMLEAGWVADHHAEFDVLHVHFGFDAMEPQALQRWIEELRRHHIPLVLTVHDLVNPHFVDSTGHLAQLDVLIPAADALITLTEQAAGEIERRWARTATVIPHPHIVPLDRIGRARPIRDGFVIGVHAKSLRANIDPLPVLRGLLAGLPAMPDAILQLDIHPDIVDPDNSADRAVALRSWLTGIDGHPQFRLSVHPRLSDAALWDYLQSIDLCVLPYRFGTHSGWLEACVDLGTGVLVPSTGCYSGQHGHPTFEADTQHMINAVGMIYADPPSARPARPDRRQQRLEIAAAHERVYRRVLLTVSRAGRPPRR